MLPEIIELALKKYKGLFDPRLFSEQLVYFDDVPETEITFLRGVVGREQAKRYFEEQVKQIVL